MEITTGQKASVTKIFTIADLKAYAALTGDDNPVHFNAEFAAQTIFKKPIVHGPLVLTLVTTLFAKELPGPGSVYLSHDVKYLHPVYLGDAVTAEIEVISVNEKGHIFLKTECKNQHGDLVLSGIARLKKY